MDLLRSKKKGQNGGEAASQISQYFIFLADQLQTWRNIVLQKSY